MEKNHEYNPEVIERFRELGGDEFIIKMIDLFLKGAEKRLQEINDALEGNRWSELGKAAHGLRSSAGNFEAQKIMELTLTLESQAQNQNVDKMRSVIHEIEERFNRLKDNLESIKESLIS